jgi:FKBP-type peptidyl-prolyl cis-trans isomerase 2
MILQRVLGDNKMTIQKGNKIKIDYVGTLEDGTEFDNSEKHGAPLEFEVGSGMVIKGFDEAVMGMKEGEEKEFTLQPDQAYGPVNPDMMKDVPKSNLPPEQEPKPGMVLLMSLPNGQQMPVRITKVDEENVSLDMNHPLAGKVLKFKIKIVSVAE